MLSLTNNLILAGPPAEPVFIATRAYAKSSPKQQENNSSPSSRVKMHSSIVATATDAALAMNSVKFMEMLTGTKNSADINTYTQLYIQQSSDDDASASINEDIPVPKEISSPSWNFMSRIFGRENHVRVEAGNIPSPLHAHGDGHYSHNHECLATPLVNANQKSKSTCPTHETVSEYVGRLWFLPDSKGGIKFRETVRVISLSADGKSSTVECNTQYHNGNGWVDCSKIICRFLSVPLINRVGGDEGTSSERELNRHGDDAQVKMTLDCELLVWLPLPKTATKAVQKKIGSVFEVNSIMILLLDMLCLKSLF